MTKRRALKSVGLVLAVALLGAGASGVVFRLEGSGPEMQRPDLLLACGICVAVYLGGASDEESEALAARTSEDTLPQA